MPNHKNEKKHWRGHKHNKNLTNNDSMKSIFRIFVTSAGFLFLLGFTFVVIRLQQVEKGKSGNENG